MCHVSCGMDDLAPGAQENVAHSLHSDHRDVDDSECEMLRCVCEFIDAYTFGGYRRLDLSQRSLARYLEYPSYHGSTYVS